jgi:hypothetical protein
MNETESAVRQQVEFDASGYRASAPRALIQRRGRHSPMSAGARFARAASIFAASAA